MKLFRVFRRDRKHARVTPSGPPTPEEGSMIRKDPGRSLAHPFMRLMTVSAVLMASVVAAPAANATDALVTQSLSGALTATDLANTLVGSGVTVSNVVYTGV